MPKTLISLKLAMEKEWEAKLMRKMEKAKPLSASECRKSWDEAFEKAKKNKQAIKVLERLSDK